jgi:hypothetical protein
VETSSAFCASTEIFPSFLHKRKLQICNTELLKLYILYKFMQYSIHKPKIIRLSALMILMSFSSILIVHIIRASHLRLIHFLAFLLGIAPNFFASIGLPFLLVTLVDILPGKRMIMSVSLLTKKLVLYCFIVYIGLSLWELV